LGYDFNTVEFGVMNGIPYAIDFCNPAPDADIHSVGPDNYDWIVENAANFAIEKALAHKDGQDNLTWGTYIRSAVTGSSMIPDVSDGGLATVPTPVVAAATIEAEAEVVVEKPAKKAAAKKTTKK
jgi:hypothetical protein